MRWVADGFFLVGTAISVLGGIGLLRFRTTFSRFHAAGKASPVGFLAIAVGAAFETGAAGAGRLALAALAMVLTLPVGVHLLFRAAHRTGSSDGLVVDELAPAERLDT